MSCAVKSVNELLFEIKNDAILNEFWVYLKTKIEFLVSGFMISDSYYIPLIWSEYSKKYRS